MTLRLLIGIVIVLLLFGKFHRGFEKMGLGRLPGDLRFRLFGREFFLPLTSGVLIGVPILLLAKFL